MDRTQYARYAEALRITEATLRAPGPGTDTEAWLATDSQVLVAASMHRTLGDFEGAIRLARWFRDSATIASQGNPALDQLAASADTTIWRWESEAAARHDKLMQLRTALLDAELTGTKHDVRAVRMAIADHAEASGHFGEASAQLYAVMLRLPTADPSIDTLRLRISDLEAREDMRAELLLPPSQRTVYAQPLGDDRAVERTFDRN